MSTPILDVSPEPGPGGDPTSPAAQLHDAVRLQQQAGRLTCTQAFTIATELGVPPLTVGRALDQLHVKITHCQLGLFGYQPDWRIVAVQDTLAPVLQDALHAQSSQGRLTCIQAWNLATRLGHPKLTIAHGCETLGIKIIHCQLGAFQ